MDRDLLVAALVLLSINATVLGSLAIERWARYREIKKNLEFSREQGKRFADALIAGAAARFAEGARQQEVNRVDA